MGGTGACSPGKVSKNDMYVVGDAIWHSLAATEKGKDVSFLLSFCPVFMHIWQSQGVASLRGSCFVHHVMYVN